MAFDYFAAAGEVLSKTGDGGKAFDAYCAMKKAEPEACSIYQGIHEMRDELHGCRAMPAEYCAEAFKRALRKLGLDDLRAA